MAEDQDKKEFERGTLPGWVGLLLTLAIFGAAVWVFFHLNVPTAEVYVYGSGRNTVETFSWWRLGGGLGLVVVSLYVLCGCIILEPNQACVVTFFGNYVGTVRAAGYHWINPLCDKQRVSLRCESFNTGVLKVNDLNGTPIEISAVAVVKVADTYKASFEIEEYTPFIKLQADSALRGRVSQLPYESPDESVHSLRRGQDEVTSQLRTEMQERVNIAGAEVVEVRIIQLAYAPEIASAMLRVQQADAVIAAREKLAEGAVEVAKSVVVKLRQPAEGQQPVHLDKADESALVRQLVVVMTSESGAAPVFNVGAA